MAISHIPAHTSSVIGSKRGATKVWKPKKGSMKKLVSSTRNLILLVLLTPAFCLILGLEEELLCLGLQ